MILSAAANWPTSVCSGHLGTRLSRSPAAISDAVFSTTRSGRNALRINQKPTAAMAAKAMAAMVTWTMARPCRISFSWVISLAMTVMTPLESAKASARHLVLFSMEPTVVG